MSDINLDEIGPVDYLVVGFPADKANFSGEMATQLNALIDSNTVRVLDLVMITRTDDGSVEASELRDADDSEVGSSRARTHLAMLLPRRTSRRSAHRWIPESRSASFWGTPGRVVCAAVRRSGGELLGNGRA